MFERRDDPWGWLNYTKKTMKLAFRIGIFIFLKPAAQLSFRIIENGKGMRNRGLCLLSHTRAGTFSSRVESTRLASRVYQVDDREHNLAFMSYDRRVTLTCCTYQIIPHCNNTITLLKHPKLSHMPTPNLSRPESYLLRLIGLDIGRHVQG